MPSIKIITYKSGDVDPQVTINIPTKVFKIAKKLIPRKAYEALEEQGIDISAIDELLSNADNSGVILEVEDHKKNEKIVISIEE